MVALQLGAQPMRVGRTDADRPQLRWQTRLGHITKGGSRPLRWALVEAAQHAGGGGPLRDSFERIGKRRGRKIAKVAVARKILTLCYYGLRDEGIRGLARCCRPSATVFKAADSWLAARVIASPAANAMRPPGRARRLSWPPTITDGRPLD
jgi:hypothetical protein